MRGLLWFHDEVPFYVFDPDGVETTVEYMAQFLRLAKIPQGIQ